MKATIITEATKELGTIGEIYVGRIPKTLKRNGSAVLAYDQSDYLVEDGWGDVIIPSYNSSTEKLGNVISSGSDFTYEVVDKTTQEVEETLKIIAQQERQQAIEELKEKQVDDEVQALTDDADLEANQKAYPLWDSLPDGYDFKANYKVRDILNGELVLFIIITPHLKQSDRRPSETPALWSEKLFGAGGIEVWTQPTGGDGQYPLIDPDTTEPYEVTHNGETWRNRRTLNTSEPGTSSSGWMQISNTPAPWYNLGNEGYPLDWTVAHNGRLWESDISDNFWEPGVSNWTDIGPA